MSVRELKEKLERASKSGTLPKIVVPVHFAGQPVEQEAIWELAQQFGFRVVEDASHSIGATRNAEPAGSCRWSDIAVFSFHPVKIVTTGEGGIATTNDGDLAGKMSMLRSHGITRDPALFEVGMASAGNEPSSDGEYPGWYYEQHALGYNYRLTDLHAALGSSQLERLDDYVERRNGLAQRYTEAFGKLPLQLPCVAKGNRSAFHLYVIQLLGESSGAMRRRVYDGLHHMGVGVNVHYMPVHLQPYYRRLGFKAGMYPHAEHHGKAAISLPLFPAMTESIQETVIDAVTEVLR